MLLFAMPAWALPTLDDPVKTGARADADSAVVIGIEDYFVLPDVPYADRDADLVHDTLVHTVGVPTDRIPAPDEGCKPRADPQGGLRGGARTGQGGRVWVYYSGHGAASPETGDRMILGADAQSDLASFTARSVTLTELRETAASGGGDPVLILDTCYSGRSRTGADLTGGKRFAVPSFAVQPEATALEWSAAGADEWSGPLEAARQGAFTWLAVGALRGWADGQRDGTRDGQVTAEEAHLYVQAGLRQLGLTDQHPVMSGPTTVALSTGTEPAPALDAPRATEPAGAGTEHTPGAPGQLKITLMAVVMVLVDGAPIQTAADEASPELWVDDLSPGEHLVEVRGAFGKPITTMTVAVGAGEQVRLNYRKKQLTEIGRGPAVERPPPVVTQVAEAVGGVAPRPTRSGNGLIAELEDLTFSSKQLDRLRELAITRTFTSALVGRILDVFDHSSHRVEAIEILAPAVVDPENVDQILEHCTFLSEKQAVRKALGG